MSREFETGLLIFMLLTRGRFIDLVLKSYLKDTCVVINRRYHLTTVSERQTWCCFQFNTAVVDSQEFQDVSRPVSWDKDYLTGS